MSSRIRVFVDWPTLAGLGAPVAAGILLGFLPQATDFSAALGIFVGIFLFVLPLGVAASYWLSCRVKDWHGQPWAYISFFVSLASWLCGIGLYLSIGGAFSNK